MSEKEPGTIDLRPGEYRRVGERVRSIFMPWWRVLLGLGLGMPSVWIGWRLAQFELVEHPEKLWPMAAWAGIVWLTAGLILVGTALGGVVRRTIGLSD
jgi:hypothetical protein